MKKKSDLKSRLEDLEREITLYKLRNNRRMVKLLESKLAELTKEFIEENVRYYEQSNIAT